MKRLLAALPVAIIAFAVPGCTSSTAPDSVLSRTSPAGPHADADTDAKFIQGLDTGNWYTTNVVTGMNPAWTDFQVGHFVAWP